MEITSQGFEGQHRFSSAVVFSKMDDYYPSSPLLVPSANKYLHRKRTASEQCFLSTLKLRTTPHLAHFSKILASQHTAAWSTAVFCFPWSKEPKCQPGGMRTHSLPRRMLPPGREEMSLLCPFKILSSSPLCSVKMTLSTCLMPKCVFPMEKHI